MLYSTQLHLRPSREHLSPLGVNRVGMSEAPLLNRCFAGRIASNDSTRGWSAPNGQTRKSPICLDAPKTKSKLKTKAHLGLGKGTFD